MVTKRRSNEFNQRQLDPVDLSDVCTINVKVTLLTVQLPSLMNGYVTINNTLTASQKKKKNSTLSP